MQAIALAAAVEDVGSLAAGEAREWLDRYQEALVLEDAFKITRQASRYAILIHLGAVVSVSLISLKKQHMRSWVVLAAG